MSVPNEDDMSSNSQLQSRIFDDLLDSIIVDVASEHHRVARLGLERNWEQEQEEVRLSKEALARVADLSNGNETSAKYVVDIFGQTHPTIASDVFDCMNCGRSIVAGRFAPHLEKCMGKNYLLEAPSGVMGAQTKYCFTILTDLGRNARMKMTRSSTTSQNRHTRGSTSAGYSNGTLDES